MRKETSKQASKQALASKTNNLGLIYAVLEPIHACRLVLLPDGEDRFHRFSCFRRSDTIVQCDRCTDSRNIVNKLVYANFVVSLQDKSEINRLQQEKL